MIPAKKLKLAQQDKGKATTSTARSVAFTVGANFPPPSLPHVADERYLSPPHFPPIIIIDMPLNVQPINEIAANPKADLVAKREKKNAHMEDEGDSGFQSAIKRQNVMTWKP